MQRLRRVTSLNVSAVVGHHALPAALLFGMVSLSREANRKSQVTFPCINGGEVGEGGEHLFCTAFLSPYLQILWYLFFLKIVESSILFFQKTEKGWREILIDINPQTNDKLRFVISPADTPATVAYLQVC